MQKLLYFLVVTTLFATAQSMTIDVKSEYYTDTTLLCNEAVLQLPYTTFKKYWILPNGTILQGSHGNESAPKYLVGDGPECNLTISHIDDDDFGWYYCFILWDNYIYLTHSLKIGLNVDGADYHKLDNILKSNVVIGAISGSCTAVVLSLFCFLYWCRYSEVNTINKEKTKDKGNKAKLEKKGKVNDGEKKVKVEKGKEPNGIAMMDIATIHVSETDPESNHLQGNGIEMNDQDRGAEKEAIYVLDKAVKGFDEENQTGGGCVGDEHRPSMCDNQAYQDVDDTRRIIDNEDIDDNGDKGLSSTPDTGAGPASSSMSQVGVQLTRLPREDATRGEDTGSMAGSELSHMTPPLPPPPMLPLSSSSSSSADDDGDVNAGIGQYDLVRRELAAKMLRGFSTEQSFLGVDQAGQPLFTQQPLMGIDQAGQPLFTQQPLSTQRTVSLSKLPLYPGHLAESQPHSHINHGYQHDGDEVIYSDNDTNAIGDNGTNVDMTREQDNRMNRNQNFGLSFHGELAYALRNRNRHQHHGFQGDELPELVYAYNDVNDGTLATDELGYDRNSAIYTAVDKGNRMARGYSEESEVGDVYGDNRMDVLNSYNFHDDVDAVRF